MKLTPKNIRVTNQLEGLGARTYLFQYPTLREHVVHRPGERLKAVTRRRHILRVAKERLVARGSYAIWIAFAQSFGIHKLLKVQIPHLVP